MATTSSYANIVSNVPRSVANSTSTVNKKTDFVPATTLLSANNRVDDEGFFTPKNSAKKRSSSESENVSNAIANSSSLSSRTKKVALQPPSPPPRKEKKKSNINNNSNNNKNNNNNNNKLKSAAAGANTPSAIPIITPKVKPGKISLCKEPPQDRESTATLAESMDAIENIADTQLLNEMLGSMTPCRSTDGEGFGSEEESCEDSPT
ncbi:hypothetical protein LOTGIDRAFT_175987 [Lottia gigantea]|uniref:Uncharacterized protein n=1 Tax=Lottia gigantea TaxID=225164 RepID=V3ZVV4_LOTGI|nr:hypothetical protein LOTGIDRAFT_175987 [Lottia gigantea]ESO86745.1 hypothetical protein LOTGIDRAFT_175987 [Lottia gigantea]